MQKEIYIISELFYPNKTSTAYIMTEIAKYLALKKQSISVICANVVYDDNFDSEISNEKLDGIKVFRTSKLLGNKNSLMGRLLNSFHSSLSFGWNVVRKVNKRDTVFAVTNPFLLVLILSIIRVFKKFDYVLLVHDVFPENGISAGLFNSKKKSYKILKKVYDWAYSKADRLIVLGRDMHELISSKINYRKEVFIIENWFDEDLDVKKQIDRNQYVGKNLTGKIIIGFAGNIGRVQNLINFIKIFIKTNNEKLHLVIIGNGAVADELAQFIEDNNFENISYLGAKPRSEQSLFLNCCDIGLVTLANGMFGLGVPSKSYNLLAMGKPILYLGDKNSEVDRLINEEKVGWSFDWDSKFAVLEFLNSLSIIDNNMILKSKRVANEKYTSSIILEKILKVITK